jgi:hypothetical protein
LIKQGVDMYPWVKKVFSMNSAGQNVITFEAGYVKIVGFDVDANGGCTMSFDGIDLTSYKKIWIDWSNTCGESRGGVAYGQARLAIENSRSFGQYSDDYDWLVQLIGPESRRLASYNIESLTGIRYIGVQANETHSLDDYSGKDTLNCWNLWLE